MQTSVPSDKLLQDAPTLPRKIQDAMSFAVPHPTIAEGIRRNAPWKAIIFLGAVTVLSFVLTALLVSDPTQVQCLIEDGEEAAPAGRIFQMVAIGDLLVFFVVMVLNGARVEFTLFSVACVACLFGGIERKAIYAGFSSGSIIVLALLFPIVKAMADTGAPDVFMTWVMGSPNGIKMVILRMIVAVTILGALFNNTPIVVMLTPMLFTFCQRLNFDAKATLMPLSFAAQAGGSLTLVGSSINLTARDVFAGGGYQIEFFTFTIGTFFVVALNCVYCVFMGPILLGKKIAPEELPAVTSPEAPQSIDESFEAIQAQLGRRNLFNVTVKVQSSSPLRGAEVMASGIHRLSGVHLVSRVIRPIAGGVVGENQTTEDWVIDPCGGLVPCVVLADGWEAVQTCVLEAGDFLQIAATGDGIAKLRTVRGIELGNESTELAYLGGKRRGRVLAEAAVAPDLVGQRVDPLEWKTRFRCGVVSIRSELEPTLCRISCHDYVIQAGDVLLLETFRDMVGSDVWESNFGVVRVVPKSSPPRNGRPADMLRAALTGTLLLGIFILSAFTNGDPVLKERMDLSVLCMLLLCVIFIIKGLTVEEAYDAVNGPILLIIAGALAMGSAMQTTRFANCAADGIVSLTKPLGTYCLFAGIYFATVAIGMVLNNAATVAIMGSIAIQVANDPDLDVNLGQLALLVTFAASACFMTPYGYQTNTFVADAAGYSWGDFIKFGMPLQLMHMVMIVLLVPFLEQVSPHGS